MSFVISKYLIFCSNSVSNSISKTSISNNLHIFTVHKKTSEQVRKLRLQIQEKAFHRKTVAISDIKSVRTAKVPALKNVKENNEKTQVNISRVYFSRFFSNIIEYFKLI